MLAIHINLSVEPMCVYSVGDWRVDAGNHNMLLSGSHSTSLEQLWVDIVTHKNVKGQEYSPLKFLGSGL